MDDKIFIAWDYSLAAVKFRGQWRFFCDVEPMFVLDLASFYGDYTPAPGDPRYGTMLVDESTAEHWMADLVAELSAEQIPNAYWQNTTDRVPLTFVIDFDGKIWAGHRWKMDQTPLQDYQPPGWLSGEDDVLAYLPPEIKSYFQ